jgi:hypothetical protein
VNFRAKLRRNSPIYKHWIGTSRIGGMINEVQFKKEGTRDFVSVDDPLPDAAITALLGHPHVQLEVSTVPVGSITVIEGFDLGGDSGGTGDPAGDPADAGDSAEDDGDPAEDTGADEPAETIDPFSPNYKPISSVRDSKAEPMMRRPGRQPKNR